MFDIFDFSGIDPNTSKSAIICTCICLALSLIAQWKLFEKAGVAGWKAIIPVYNMYTLCKIADTSGWKFLLLLIPFVNIIYEILLCIRLAKVFGKGGLFALGLILLQPIFMLILGFGNARYER